MLLRALFLFLVTYLIGACTTASDIALSVVPMRSMDIPETDPAYDAKIKSQEPPPGKSIVFVFQPATGEVTDVYVNEEGIGRIWPGTYLYTFVEPGPVTIKSTIQLRKRGFSYSHPTGYHNSWGVFEATAGDKYFIELRFEGTSQQLANIGSESGQSQLGSTNLSFMNSLDATQRGFPERKDVDICPFGETTPRFYSQEEVEAWDLTCTYDRDF